MVAELKKPNAGQNSLDIAGKLTVQKRSQSTHRTSYSECDHQPIRVQERLTKVRRGGRCNFHRKCGWNLTRFDEVLSERKQSTNPDEYIEDELGKDECRCPSFLLRWAVPRHSVRQQPLAWDPTWHPCPRRDGCCVQSFLPSANSSSNRADLLAEPTSWVGTLGRASLWDFFYTGLFLNPFQMHTCTVLLKALWFYSFPPSPIPPIQRKSEMTQCHSHGSWPHRRTLSATTEANGKTVPPSKYWKIILCPIKVLLKIEG